MGREKSDRRIVPAGRRKTVRSSAEAPGGGKASTVSEQAMQLEMFSEPVDSPKGAEPRENVDRSTSERRKVPLSENKKGRSSSRMEMEKVAAEANLRRAFNQVSSNDGAPGPDGRSISEVAEALEETLPRLRDELLSGNYRPGRIRRVWIPKDGGRRGLGIPDVIDRWVQQATAQVLSPIWTPRFHRSSHGFIKGRSCHTAIEEAIEYLKGGKVWLVDLDLEKFFDQVNRQRLLSRIGQTVDDPRLLKLIGRMLKAEIVMPEGVVVKAEAGLPQGGPLSPLLANIVLDELDWELYRRGLDFVRYADDCQIFVRSERSAHRVMAGVTRFIEKKLRLKVNASKSAVALSKERQFLGFTLSPDPETGKVESKLSKKTLDRIKKKVVELTPRNWGQSLRTCIQKLNEYLNGWIGYFWIVGDCEERKLRNLESHIRRRLRAIVLRHCKRKRTIWKRLVQGGIKKARASRVVFEGKRSWWALSHGFEIHNVLNNRHFSDLGLISISDRRNDLYTRHHAARRQLILPLG